MIKCGNCKNSHQTVADVRTCYAGGKAAVRLADRSPLNLQTGTGAPEATSRQVNYALDLARKRDIARLVFSGPTLDKIRENVAAIERREPEPYHVTRLDASHLIDELLSCPRLPETWKTAVPDGRYAVEIGGKLRFFHVTRTKQDSLKIRERAGDALHAKRFVEYRTIIDAILRDGVEDAGRRYGRELESCWMCGRGLTDEVSRTLGEGPVCGGRV